MKSFELWFRFHWSLVLGVYMRISQHFSSGAFLAEPFPEPMMIQFADLCGISRLQWVNGNIRSDFNSLAPGRSEWDSKNVIFNLVLLIGIFRSSHHNALRWMPQDLTDDKSTLVQVMAWCCQATSHYLSQCWLSSCRLMASLGHNKLRCSRVPL